MTVRNSVLRFSIFPATLLALAAASPASAQYHDWHPDPAPVYRGQIHPHQIEGMVRSMGFQPVADPRPRGPLWVTHAVDRNGQQVRVLIDAYTGRLIDVLRRPTPPQNVAYAPPPNFPPSNADARIPSVYPPMASVPESDYDEGPDYDYRNFPRSQYPHQPQIPVVPNTVQRGPSIVPFDARSDNTRLPNAPKTNTAKKKEVKKKNETTAAINPEKQNPPSPKARPEEAPKPETKKKDQPKADAPKTAQMPKMPATDSLRGPDPNPTGAVKPEVPTFVPNKDQQPNTPPVQPPF